MARLLVSEVKSKKLCKLMIYKGVAERVEFESAVQRTFNNMQSQR